MFATTVSHNFLVFGTHTASLQSAILYDGLSGLLAVCSCVSVYLSTAFLSHLRRIVMEVRHRFSFPAAATTAALAFGIKLYISEG